MNISRRIQRPEYSLLNPFLNTATLGQYTSGNPSLKPYSTSKFEFQFSKNYGKANFFLGSLYFSRSKNIYSSYIKYDSMAEMNVETYGNFRSLNTYGTYFVLQNNITKWFNFNAYLAGTLPVFGTKIQEDILLPSLFYVTGNLSLNFTLPEKTQFQIYGYFVTKNNNFQVQNFTSENISIAAQHKFFKGHLTASINLEDIFNINDFPIRVYNENVFLDAYNKLKSRYFKFGLSYDFGKAFKSQSSKELKKDSRTD